MNQSFKDPKQAETSGDEAKIIKLIPHLGYVEECERKRRKSAALHEALLKHSKRKD